MRYTNYDAEEKQLYPMAEWRSVVGYWIEDDGTLFNFPDAIANSGGHLEPDNPKQKSMALFALNYAKQRREQTRNALQIQIANLDRAIKRLEGIADT